MENLTEQVWEPAEIQQGLRQLPTLIGTQTRAEIDAEAQVKEIKHYITLNEAAVKVQHSDEKLTATALNALAYQETAELHEQLLESEKKYELEKARTEYFRDMFDSCRKAASVQMEEVKHMSGSVGRKPGF